MKISAVIAEYNPFHYGHKYQLENMKQASDAVAVIMSGPFVQRGEAAITDKWTRAEAALLNGADAVFELPVIYALNTAQSFAFGAVDILNRTNIIDELWFGSECGQIDELTAAADILENEPKEVSEKIKKLTADGMLFPKARETAVRDFIPNGILSMPNNILAVEYIRALMRKNSKIKPITLKRDGAGYHDTVTEKNTSAAGIRERIKSGEKYADLMPCANFDIYRTDALDTAVTARLRTISEEELSKINGVSEGLENRIISAAMKYSTIKDISAAVKTKRYTMTRINRILMSALLGMTGNLCSRKVNYVRVLGMNKKGAEIIREIKHKSDLKIITKTADYKRNDPVFNMDIKAQSIFSLCGEVKKGNTDFTVSPIIT